MLSRVVGGVTSIVLATLALHGSAAPQEVSASPKAFVYVPVPKPVNGLLQYGQSSGGRLLPLKPFVVPVPGSYVPLSITDPKGHFLYVGTSPLRQFRVGGNGQLVPLKPATVPLPETNAAAFTPDGHFAYLSHTHFDEYGSTNTPDDLTICRVAADGSLHPIRNGVVLTGPQVSALAVDRTGKFLYVCVYNYDPSGNLAYTMPYQIQKDGTLRGLSTKEYNCVPDPTAMAASPSGPYIYMASKSGISTWSILPDGTLHLLQDESVYLRVPTFVVDAGHDLLIGIGKPTAGSTASGDQLVVWHRQADGTLTEPAGAAIATDGFLYADEAAIPKGRNAFPVGLVLDADHDLLYVRDSATDRIFRYQVHSDGSLRLQVPWLSTGVPTLDALPRDNPLLLGKGG